MRNRNGAPGEQLSKVKARLGAGVDHRGEGALKWGRVFGGGEGYVRDTTLRRTTTQHGRYNRKKRGGRARKGRHVQKPKSSR